RLASSRSWLMVSKISSAQVPTLMQKLRLALRGWSRRREEAKKDFVARNAAWGTAQAPSPVQSPHVTTAIDIDGLTVAYLDDSGHFAHYLDTDTGDRVVAEKRRGRSAGRGAQMMSSRRPPPAPRSAPCPLAPIKKPRSSRGLACRRSPVLRKRKGGNVVRSRQRDLDHLQLRHRLL